VVTDAHAADTGNPHAVTAAQVEAATVAQGLLADSAVQLSSNLIISGTTHTIVAANEGNRLRATNETSFELTLIEFSAKDTLIHYRQVGAVSPTLGALPTGMTIISIDQDKFTNLVAGGDVTFICVDATAGAQIVEIILFSASAVQKCPEAFPYPTENLAGFWTNEEVTGSTVTMADYTGNNNDASLYSGTGGVPAFPSPSTAITITAGDVLIVADIPAYDAINNVFFWFYYTGNTDPADIIDLGVATFTTAFGEMQEWGMTDPAVYVNGQLASAISVGWNFITITTSASINLAFVECYGPLLIDSLGLDDGPAFTAQKVLDIYNATSSAYP
jgi:hypothetical protein